MEAEKIALEAETHILKVAAAEDAEILNTKDKAPYLRGRSWREGPTRHPRKFQGERM